MLLADLLSSSRVSLCLDCLSYENHRRSLDPEFPTNGQGAYWYNSSSSVASS